MDGQNTSKFNIEDYVSLNDSVISSRVEAYSIRPLFNSSCKPRIFIEGKEYVDKEYIYNLIHKEILDAERECGSEDKMYGIQMCRSIISRLFEDVI